MKLQVGEKYLHDNKLWELVAVSSQKLTLKLVKLFQEETKEIDTVLSAKLLKHTKQAAPALLSVDVCSQRLCPEVCSAQMKQAEAWLLLLKTAETKHAKLWKYICMDGARKAAYSACNIGAKQLLLAPETDAAAKVSLKEVDDKKKHGIMKYCGQQYCILPPALYKAGNQKPDTGHTSPFWWLQPAEESNMEFVEVALAGHNMIRCLTNPKSIKKHQQLTLPMPLEAQPEPAEPAQPVKKKPKKA